MISLDKIINPIKAFIGKVIPKGKKSKTAKADLQFVSDNKEVLSYYVRYGPVFKAFVERVSEEEKKALNAEKPCRFRQDGDVPFIVVCKAHVEGQDKKQLAQCEECVFRSE